MKNVLSLILFTEVFEQQAIPVIPFLCLLLVGSPFLIIGAMIKHFVAPEEERPKYPQEIADEELLAKVRRGKVAPDAPGVDLAENRVYFGYYDLKAIDEGIV